MKQEPGIILAVTGASGAVYARQLLLRLSAEKYKDVRKAVIFSPTALKVWAYETGTQAEIPDGFTLYDAADYFAPPASGSADYGLMIVCPCSMGTLGRIANGVSSCLITRAADVMIKEKRKLILVPREMPYSLIHVRNMEQLLLAGATICPASPSFYALPSTAGEIIETVTDKIMSLAGLSEPSFRWNGV